MLPYSSGTLLWISHVVVFSHTVVLFSVVFISRSQTFLIFPDLRVEICVVQQLFSLNLVTKWCWLSLWNPHETLQRYTIQVGIWSLFLPYPQLYQVVNHCCPLSFVVIVILQHTIVCVQPCSSNPFLISPNSIDLADWELQTFL